MTRPSPVSAVHRALAGLSLAPVTHAADLAAQAKHLLQRRDGIASWLLAERLTRLRFGLIADDLVLRAITLAAMNNGGLARDDVRNALAIDPRHPMANRLMLSSPDPAERTAAARRLLRSDGTTAQIQDALGVLWSQGAAAAGRLDSAPRHIRGWLAWRSGSALKCYLDSSHGRVEHRVEPEPGHRIASALVHAADISWPWPGDAEWVEVACDAAPSELLPERLRRHAVPPTPRSQRPQTTAAAAAVETRRVAVIVPVYDDFEATKQCFEAVLAHPERHVARRIIAVDDATPDQRIAVLLDELARNGKIELLRNDVNQGFAASVNRGLAMLADDEDAVLLNADTVPPPDLCGRLARVAYLHDDIGTVTPLSNNGEYTSLPVRFRENPLPQADALTVLDRLAAETSAGVGFVELPNGIGFCLYVKRAVLDAVGFLSLQFGRGYCEDIDFCLRARQAGFRNVCATGVFVGHAGTRSFKSEKRALVLSNLSRIDDLYPTYRRQSAEFVRRDPLREPASRLEWKWLLARKKGFSLVVTAREPDPRLIGRHADAKRSSGLDTIVATLDVTSDGVTVDLRDHAGGYPQNLVLAYRPDRAPQELADAFSRLQVAEVAIADPGNLPVGFVQAIAEIGVVHDVLLADTGIFDIRGDRKPVIAAILPKARRISTTTPRFQSALISRMPDLASKIDLLPDAPLGNATVQSSSEESSGLLIVGADSSAEDSELIHAFAARLREAHPEAGVIVDGALSDDFKTMELGNVFVLGRPSGESLMPATGHTPTRGVFFQSRRWGMSDTRVDAVMALGLPVAYFDHAVQQCKTVGGNLLLSANEPLPIVVSALLLWWGRLSAERSAAMTVSAVGPTPVPLQPG